MLSNLRKVFVSCSAGLALLALLVGVSAFAPAANAHGRTKTSTTPNSCYYGGLTSNSRVYNQGTVKFGTYYVYIEHNTCNHNLYQIYATFNADGTGGCLQTYMRQNGSVNGVDAYDSNTPPPSISFGPYGCAQSFLSTTSPEFGANPGDSISGCLTVTINEATQPALCAYWTA